MGIVQLENPPKNKKAKVKIMKEFEGYWQVKVGTIKPHGMNDMNELKEFYYMQSMKIVLLQSLYYNNFSPNTPPPHFSTLI